MNKLVKGKTALLKDKTNQYEQSMKNKFIDIMKSDQYTYSDCLDFISSEISQSKKMAKFKYNIPCFINDGIYQLNQAISEVFGSASSKEEDSPSSDGSVNTVDVILADGTRVKAPYGNIALPALGEEAYININYDECTHELYVTGKCQFRFSSLIDDIIEVTKENISTKSIYKGQALEIMDLNNPKILDLSTIDNQLMILSDQTEYDLRPIKARILNPDKCTEKGIPLKFGALLEGGLTF